MMNEIYELMIRPGTTVTQVKKDPTHPTGNGEDHFIDMGNVEGDVSAYLK